MDLPEFVYHPDPIGTGSVVESEETCDCCGWEQGAIYKGPIHFATMRKPLKNLCPWCIGDGSAREKFNVSFCDSIMGEESIPPEVTDTILHRTPGFPAWRETKWWTHCGDAAVYQGSYGWRELQKLDDPELIATLKEPYQGLDEPSWSLLASALHRDRGGASAFIFKCRVCEKLGGYIDEL